MEGERMACTLHVAWDGRLAAYDFGTGHPTAPACRPRRAGRERRDRR